MTPLRLCLQDVYLSKARLCEFGKTNKDLMYSCKSSIVCLDNKIIDDEWLQKMSILSIDQVIREWDLCCKTQRHPKLMTRGINQILMI